MCACLQGAGPDQAAQPGVAPRPPQALPRAALHLRRGCAPCPAVRCGAVRCSAVQCSAVHYSAVQCGLCRQCSACMRSQQVWLAACSSCGPSSQCRRHCCCGCLITLSYPATHPPTQLPALPCIDLPAEASPEEFFVPYVWSLAVAQAGIPWRLSAITLFTPTGTPTAQCHGLTALHFACKRPKGWWLHALPAAAASSAICPPPMPACSGSGGRG